MLAVIPQWYILPHLAQRNTVLSTDAHTITQGKWFLGGLFYLQLVEKPFKITMVYGNNSISMK